MNPKTLPTILIIIDVAAAVVYGCHGDARKTVYWFAAAVFDSGCHILRLQENIAL